MAEQPTNLELRDIVVAYGALRAIDGVSLAVGAGQVLGVCGDNGAGKSSLMKVIAGAHVPTSGEVHVDGVAVRMTGPRDALSRGIAAIYQDLALAPRLSIAENVFMGAELTRGGWLRLLDKAAMRRRAGEYLARLDIDMPSTDTPVAQLSGGQRQAVAIARTRLSDPRIVLMDEPTAAISVRQVAEVLDLIRRMKSHDTAVILISHRMPDVFAVCDRIVVLRRGTKVADRPVAKTSPEEITGLITGAIDAA